MRCATNMTTRQQKITLGEMRASGVRGLLIYCADYHCSHSTAICAERWADDVRLSDLEPLFVCKACGKHGAGVRPDFNWKKSPVHAMGFATPADEMLRACHGTRPAPYIRERCR